MEPWELDAALSRHHAQVVDAEERVQRVRRKRPIVPGVWTLRSLAQYVVAVAIWQDECMEAQLRLSELNRSAIVLILRARQEARPH